MTGFRRKNISREIRDIRFPTSHVPDKPAAAEKPMREIRPVPAPPRPTIRPRRYMPKRPIAIFLSIAFVFFVCAGVIWYRQQVAQAERLREALGQTGHSHSSVDILGLGSNAPTSWQGWLSLIQTTFSYYGDFGQASLSGLEILDGMNSLANELPGMVLRKDGQGLIATLTSLQDKLGTLKDSLQKLGSGKADLESVLPDISGYLAYAPDIERAQAAVGGMLALLKDPGAHHILVLFGNSAELRPGGGFLGSFADLPLGNGAVGDLTIHDVNEVDRGFTKDIVPPKPLQGIVTRWRTADANWFFDYPQSAKKTLEFMSQSSFYASSTEGVTLDGAILISPRVIQDTLAVTGPLTLTDGKTVVDSSTIIPLIQREVQAGQANGAEDPKEILSELLPPLQDKLQKLDKAAQDRLVAAGQKWLQNKDLLVYFAKPELAKVAAYYGLDGGLYATSENFAGDYLATVNANVGGGKSDAFISDFINLESDLGEDGTITDRLSVTRTNRADVAGEWWYQVTNQDYLQIFTAPGAVLTSAAGGKAREIGPRADYSQGFAVDADLAAMEATLKPVAALPSVTQFRETGKNVFATWLTTAAGAKSMVTFEYNRRLRKPFRDGDHYTFAFERQSGARQSVHAVLTAPPGFIWKESGGPKFLYDAAEAPGRAVIDLTLEKF